jgi:hypothetical protein
MRAYTAPYPEDVPIDGTTYQEGSVIGSATIVISVGTQTSFSAESLNANTDYYFDVLAYTSDHNYLTSNPLEGHRQTGNESDTPPTGLTFSDITDNSLTLSFAGSQSAPTGYLTVMQAFSSPYPDAIPQDGIVYHEGDLIGGSSIVVGTEADTTVNVIYLQADTEYFFDVYPYTGTDYNTDHRTSGSQQTLSGHESARLAPYPNPFTDAITIPFSNDKPAQVQVVIYDRLGRVVSLTEASFDAGDHQLNWNRVDANGNKCQNGVYIYSIRNSLSGRVIKGAVLAR